MFLTSPSMCSDVEVSSSARAKRLFEITMVDGVRLRFTRHNGRHSLLYSDPEQTRTGVEFAGEGVGGACGGGRRSSRSDDQGIHSLVDRVSYDGQRHRRINQTIPVSATMTNPSDSYEFYYRSLTNRDVRHYMLGPRRTSWSSCHHSKRMPISSARVCSTAVVKLGSESVWSWPLSRPQRTVIL